MTEILEHVKVFARRRRRLRRRQGYDSTSTLSSKTAVLKMKYFTALCLIIYRKYCHNSITAKYRWITVYPNTIPLVGSLKVYRYIWAFLCPRHLKIGGGGAYSITAVRTYGEHTSCTSRILVSVHYSLKRLFI